LEDSHALDVAEDSHALDVAKAREILMAECMRRRDDVTLRRLRAFGDIEAQHKKRAATETGVILRKRAQEVAEAEAKRRKEREAEIRLSANEDEARKARVAKAQQAAAQARTQALKHVIENRRAAKQHQTEAIKAKEDSRWLQTVYPAQLAARYISDHKLLKDTCKAEMKKRLRTYLNDKFFTRHVYIPDLWAVDTSLLITFCQVQEPGGVKRQHWVRCSAHFENEVKKVFVDKIGSGPDPVGALKALFRAFVPLADEIFVGAYSPLRMLHMNDFVMEKAFVFGCIALSKWLGPERWPHGVFGEWPPKRP